MAAEGTQAGRTEGGEGGEGRGGRFGHGAAEGELRAVDLAAGVMHLPPYKKTRRETS